LKDIITPGPGGISFISGGSGIQELARMTRDQVVYLTGRLLELDKMADIIIVDTGAGIADNVLEFVVSSSEVLLVATPEPTSITDAYALLKALNKKAEFSKKDTKIRMISNRVRNDAEGEVLYDKMSVVVEKFLHIPLDYLGCVPEDDALPKAVMKQRPVSLINPNSASSKAFSQIASELAGENEKKDDAPRGISQLFSNLIRTKMRGRKSK
ncbi:MAG: MinD/ParA family protein, partial [Lachnospiraceae bacterium]|nr:MinD/ParA family protein [Lachnospiraceae bacterium]